MDPYRALDKENKLSFNFKMWILSKIDFCICITPPVLLLFIFVAAADLTFKIKAENQKNEKQDILELKFFEAKCFPNLFLEGKYIRQGIRKLTCACKDGKQNEIYVDLKEMVK